MTAVLLVSGLMPGCGSTDSSDPSGTLQIRMIDAPAEFAQVILVVRRIEIHRSGFAADLGWRVVGDVITKVNLLTLRNGNTDTLVWKDVPAGSYDKIRVLFGISQIYLSGSAVPLTVDIPSDIANGYIVDIPFTVADGQSYELVMDVDAYRSLRQTAPNQYALVPVMRVQSTATAGSIAGAVLAEGAPVSATVSTGAGGVAATTLNDVNAGGSFLLDALPEGQYTILIQPSDTVAYADTTIANLIVRRKAVTVAPTVILRNR